MALESLWSQQYSYCTQTDLLGAYSQAMCERSPTPVYMMTCKKHNGKPYTSSDPTPLFKYRLRDVHPFTVTGVEFTGALYVRNNSEEIKVYVCLFTCATSRAIHLEIVTDLSTATFCWRSVDLLVVDHYQNSWFLTTLQLTRQQQMNWSNCWIQKKYMPLLVVKEQRGSSFPRKHQYMEASGRDW